MRKLILWAHISLDGFTAGPNGELDWLFHHVSSEAGWEALARTIRAADTVILGRVNYEGFYHYWPTVAANPSSPRRDADFAGWIHEVEKIVYSKTLSRAEWNNTTLVDAIEHDEVVKLKEREGRDIVILNSGSVARCLTQLGLVDEFRINIFPVILGARKSIFRDIQQRVDLRLIEAKTAPSGVVECIYRIAGGDD